MRRFALAAALLCGTFLSAQAQTLRWANDGDVNSMDPYTRNETLLLAFNSHIYEPLVRRDRNMEPEPALAERWEQPSPTVWRFHLRRGVKFTDGTPFTADDVVFSVQRVRAPGSNLNAVVATVKEVRKLDDHTVEFETNGPNPILIRELATFGIMSKQWSEKNNAARPADLTSREENFATRNAMGTGPFKLVSREPDRRTVLERNPDWWDKPAHNVERIEFTVIANDATRVAALLSGEVDFVLDPPIQDLNRLRAAPGVKVLEGPEVRTLYIVFDVFRDELLYSDVKGRNPFKDLRVRQALYHAIDIQAIQRTTMRGQSVVTGTLFPEQVNGYAKEEDVRLPFDPNRARALLAEAGYPNGFSVTLDCPNNRYINDEQICQAIAAMWARVGVRTALKAQPIASFFAQIQRDDTSVYMLGWGVPTLDALYSFQSLLASRGSAPGDGIWNFGRYSNPRMDELVARMKTEAGPARQAAVREALKLYREDVPHIPLHHQMIPWAMRANLSIPHAANNQPFFRWAVVN